MKNYVSPLEPDKYYHIYNHAAGKDLLFTKNDNYNFFLQQFSKYINPVADTFAYCLMPNHFHFLIRIKEDKDLTGFQNLSGLKAERRNQASLTNFISNQFSKLFNSYAKAYNKQQKRRGTLFERPFKRIHIESNKYIRNLIHYIHYNPEHHGFIDDFKEWKYSSFKSLLSEKVTNLKRKEVIELFDDKDNFLYFHKREIDYDFIGKAE
ncbi:MAG: hypothetical protein L3J56_09215 [Bacteroidales bacterium]|nr:hypothetical protein [Bacteroidales bacterium]